MLNSLVVAASIIGCIFSFFALAISIWNIVEIQASKRATHTVLPLPTNSTSPLADLEKKLNSIVQQAGGDQSDINRGLFEAGVDPDELV